MTCTNECGLRVCVGFTVGVTSVGGLETRTSNDNNGCRSTEYLLGLGRSVRSTQIIYVDSIDYIEDDDWQQ